MSRRGRPAPARPAPARPAAAARPPLLSPAAMQAIRFACFASPLPALAALAWSLRDTPLGTPAADDYEFLSRVVFHHRLDWFDSMGATYYWRPLSRQLWFSLVTPLLLAAPGVVAAVHVALLGAVAFVLARLARPLVDAPGAALVAAAVLTAEPARALLTWPSGIQHLLAALGLALAAHEAFAGRRWTAALAAVLAAGSHELGVLGFALVAATGWLRGERGRGAWTAGALGLALGALWALGYRTALAHGVQLPAGGFARAAGAWLESLRLGVQAAFNAETLSVAFAQPLTVATGLLFAGALVWLLTGPRAARAGREAPLLGGTLALAWLALLPLGALLPDWNAWRAFVPVLAIVFATTLTFARAHLALGLLVVLVRSAALAGAAPASPITGDPPPAVSDLSFARLARIQSTVRGVERAVRGAATLGPRARVAYWGLPQLTMNGFRNDLAAQVWARDTSVRFVAFEGRAVVDDPPDVTIAFDVREGHAPVVVVSHEALHWFSRGMAASDSGRDAEARACYEKALAVQRPEAPSLSSQLLHNIAVQEITHARWASADSLNQLATTIRGITPDGFGIDALIALGRGDAPRAARYIAACLKLDPRNVVGLYARKEYARMTQAGAGAAPAAR